MDDGRIALPEEVRLALRVKAGDRVRFVPVEDGYRLVPVSVPITALKGLVRPLPAPIPLEVMDEAVAEGAVDSGLG